MPLANTLHAHFMTNACPWLPVDGRTSTVAVHAVYSMVSTHRSVVSAICRYREAQALVLPALNP